MYNNSKPIKVFGREKLRQKQYARKLKFKFIAKYQNKIEKFNSTEFELSSIGSACIEANELCEWKLF